MTLAVLSTGRPIEFARPVDMSLPAIEAEELDPFTDVASFHFDLCLGEDGRVRESIAALAAFRDVFVPEVRHFIRNQRRREIKETYAAF